MPQDATKPKIGGPIPKTGVRLLEATTEAVSHYKGEHTMLGRERIAVYQCPICGEKIMYSEEVTPFCRVCIEPMVKQKEKDDE